MNLPKTTKKRKKAGPHNGGAPLGNANGLRHGRYSRRVIPSGKLPPKCGYIRALTNKLSRELESAVLAVHGEITLVAAATISTACRFERHCQLAQKWLRENPTLDVETRLAISRDIPRASAERDKAIRSLGLPISSTNADNMWALPAPPVDIDDDDEDNSLEARRARRRAAAEAERATADDASPSAADDQSAPDEPPAEAALPDA